jgi:hypothetical protein
VKAPEVVEASPVEDQVALESVSGEPLRRLLTCNRAERCPARRGGDLVGLVRQELGERVVGDLPAPYDVAVGRRVKEKGGSGCLHAPTDHNNSPRSLLNKA